MHMQTVDEKIHRHSRDEGKQRPTRRTQRIERLFGDRWRDKCGRPCRGPVYCSCLQWALDRGEV